MARVLTAILLCAAAFFISASASAQDYAPVNAIFSKYCLDCHSSKDPDGDLVLENYESLMKGGKSGSPVKIGDSSISLLFRMVEGSYIKEGKKLIMPPGRKRKKLETSEVESIKNWIDAGAKPPAPSANVIANISVPKISTIGAARDPINALVNIPQSALVARARQSQVE